MKLGVQPALGKIAYLLGPASTLPCEYIGQGSKELYLHRYTVMKGAKVESDEWGCNPVLWSVTPEFWYVTVPSSERLTTTELT